MLLETEQDLFHSEALKSSVSTNALRYSLCNTGKEFEQLEFSLFGIKTAKTSNKRLQLAARFHIYKLCYVTSLLVSFPIVNEVNCISGAKNWLPSLFLSKVVLSVGWVDRIILRIEINQF